MKLTAENARIVSAALRSGAIARSQRAELLELAESFGGGLTPQSIGYAVAVLRSGGVAESKRRATSEDDRATLERVGASMASRCEGVSTRAVPQCSIGGKRTSNACAPKAARIEIAGARGFIGAPTEIIVEGARGLKRLSARWALLPIGSLLTSNDPLRGFAPRPGYPRQLQERDYEKGETEQSKVRSAAGALVPELLLSDNRDALTGAPIVDRQLRVLGGNGRTMALIIHLADGGTAYAKALASELACSTCFGLWGAVLSPDLVLVRILDQVGDVLAISRELNAPLSAAMTREGEAFSLGQRLSDRTLGHIGESLSLYETASEAIDGSGKALVADLIADSIITPNQRPAWLQTLGGEVESKLNRSGKERLIDALVALSVRDARITRDASPAIVQLMTQVAPTVIRLDRWDTGNRTGYNWAPVYRRALPFVVATASILRDTASLRAYWGTRSLFEGSDFGLDASALRDDLAGLCAYWWIVSLLGHPKLAAAAARKSWSAIPAELKGEKSLYGLRDRLELAESGEDPFSVLIAVGWPSLAGAIAEGANGLIGSITSTIAGGSSVETAIRTFNEKTESKARGARAQMLEAWQPQVIPLRATSKAAEEERAALVESLRPVEELDFRLTPFEAPQRNSKSSPAKLERPWAALRALGLSLPLAKRLTAAGYTESSLRAALLNGDTIEGFGKTRRAALRALLGLPEEAPKARRPKHERARGADALTYVEKLIGGAADGMPDSAFPARELARGMRHELEHTTDPQIAREIAKDHLVENQNYYQQPGI